MDAYNTTRKTIISKAIASLHICCVFFHVFYFVMSLVCFTIKSQKLGRQLCWLFQASLATMENTQKEGYLFLLCFCSWLLIIMALVLCRDLPANTPLQCCILVVQRQQQRRGVRWEHAAAPLWHEPVHIASDSFLLMSMGKGDEIMWVTPLARWSTHLGRMANQTVVVTTMASAALVEFSRADRWTTRPPRSFCREHVNVF